MTADGASTARVRSVSASHGPATAPAKNDAAGSWSRMRARQPVALAALGDAARVDAEVRDDPGHVRRPHHGPGEPRHERVLQPMAPANAARREPGPPRRRAQNASSPTSTSRGAA